MKEEIGKGRPTDIPGVFLFRLLASKGRPANLAIEINLIDTYGYITKKRGVVIRSASELDDISRLLSHPKVGELSKKIDVVNPKTDATTGKGSPDILDVFRIYSIEGRHTTNSNDNMWILP